MESYGKELTNYPVEGNNTVDKIRYDPPQPSLEKEGEEKTGKVWINKTQHFEGISQQVWEFYIGGYQVCHKWLKDRKGRTLSYEDLEHYHNIVSAIAETIELMEKIDFTINKYGGFPIN